MKDGLIKNALRGIVKLINKNKYDKYVKDIQERSEKLPEFSLFTSDCMGGLIYHTCNRKFLSPTINMSIEDSFFLKLLSDLPYYFSQEIRFKEWENYPIGAIGEGEKEIIIKFEHYKSEKDVIEKWNNRKKRITNNIFVVMADKNLSDDEIVAFEKLSNHLDIKRKIMFTWNKERADNKEIFYIKDYGRKRIKNYSKLRKDGFRDYEIFFDYVKWLNMEEDFMLD